MRVALIIHAGIQNLAVRGLASSNTVHSLIQRIFGILQFLPAGVQVGLGLIDLTGKSFGSLLQAILHTVFRFCELLTDSCMRIRQFFADCCMGFLKLLTHGIFDSRNITVHLLDIHIYVLFQLPHLCGIMGTQRPVAFIRQRDTGRHRPAADITVAGHIIQHDHQGFIGLVLFPDTHMVRDHSFSNKLSHFLILSGLRLIVSHDQMTFIVHLKDKSQLIPCRKHQMPVHIDRRGDQPLCDVLCHLINGAGHRALRQTQLIV